MLIQQHLSGITCAAKEAAKGAGLGQTAARLRDMTLMGGIQVGLQSGQFSGSPGATHKEHSSLNKAAA
jgi:hypothetical protein